MTVLHSLGLDQLQQQSQRNSVTATAKTFNDSLTLRQHRHLHADHDRGLHCEGLGRQAVHDNVSRFDPGVLLVVLKIHWQF